MTGAVQRGKIRIHVSVLLFLKKSPIIPTRFFLDQHVESTSAGSIQAGKTAL